jgi:hypothetical protein
MAVLLDGDMMRRHSKPGTDAIKVSKVDRHGRGRWWRLRPERCLGVPDAETPDFLIPPRYTTLYRLTAHGRFTVLTE